MKLTTLALALALGTTTAVAAEKPKPFLWENATVYFLLTDRFSNAFTGNDLAYDRRADAARCAAIWAAIWLASSTKSTRAISIHSA
jgi:hypothetical protein